MKWKKINQRTGEPARRGNYSFEPHDYVYENYRIINNSFHLRKKAWTLTKDGKEVDKFDTLKAAKIYAETH